MKQIQAYIYSFLQKPSSLPKLVCIVGPTGSGKTDLSLEIAEKFNGEIINADSKQVYKNIPVTTGVIPEKERKNIPHHLFEFIEPSKVYSVEEHKNDALKIINGIIKRKKLPILVGGTGLFINTLTENFQIPENSVNEEIRKNLEEKTEDELWNELLNIDPEYAKTTHKNNKLRVIRALEVFYSSGKQKSEAKKGELLFDVFILMKEIDREELYKKINTRAEWMWNNGVKDEAKKLYDQNLDKKLPALTAYGIPEAFDFFDEKITEQEAIERMQQKSRNYAKRQLTWWRNDERIILISQ